MIQLYIYVCVCVCVCVCVFFFIFFSIMVYHRILNIVPCSYFYLFTYLFMAALGLHCCVRAFSSCGEQGLLFIVVRGLLIAVASLVVEHGF